MTATRCTHFGIAGLLALGSVLLTAPVVSADVTLPGDIRVDKVDFERHVMGLFGRMGCNSGSCHGSFQGKGGFRLSLFGYDPEKDYATLTRDVLGRRVNPADPDHSLILLKATGQALHEGGKRFEVGSWQYQLLREWITNGLPRDKGSGIVSTLTVTPAEQAFQKPGQTAQLKVTARFADGSEADITPLCEYRTNNDAVAEVSPLGQVRSAQEGDTAIVIGYRGIVRAVRVMVPRETAAGFQYPQVPEVNYVDREVLAKLRRLNIVPSDLAGDAEFLRRVTLDTIGCLPTPEEIRAFLADPSSDKRAKKIDELLAHPLHAALWATKFSDITGNETDALENPQQLKSRRSQMWHDWLRKRLATNMPYDEIVKGILTATSRDGQAPEEWIKEARTLDEALQKGFETPYADKATLDLFWRRQQPVLTEQWGEKTAVAFLGVRLECAQCHKHPFDRWTQVDYRSYANVFSQVAVGVSPEMKQLVDAENKERQKNQAKNKNQVVQIREVFIGTPTAGKGASGGGKSLTHPDTNLPLPAQALGGPEIKNEKGQDARAALWEWLRSPENPYFARSFVNRVWGHYFGIGIVQPVDDFSQANPPANPTLLDALAKDFSDHNYDIRHVERTILLSRSYQLTAQPNETNRLDRSNFSHSFPRILMAEAVVDSINVALGVSENFGNEAPPNCRAIEVGSTRLNNQAYALRVFGRPQRSAGCDCERAPEPALAQTLYRMTDAALLAKLKAKDGRLQKLLQSNKSDDEVFEELFLATLSRLPNEKEKQLFADTRANTKDRQALFTDVAWALLNTREFILNH
jgi:hypothetical protein